jgi:hypothetical protein
MTVRAANVKGITFLYEALGSALGGIALVTFDLVGVPYTGGSDTITLGGGGYDDEVATTNTLATIMSLRRRDGKTVTLTGVGAVGPQVGYQLAASANGPLLYVQAATLSGGNVTSITLNTAYTGGSSVTTVSTSYWDRPAGIVVTYQATGY